MFLFKSKKSQNYEERPLGVAPNILLLHYTGMETADMARERLTDPESKVSAHYFIDEDGRVEALVPEKYRAWHAGVSYWRRETDINSYSIGVEIVNPGHEFGYRPFPQPQMEGVLSLAQAICRRHAITHVLGHSDVAPERKMDPGELFDWPWLAQNGIGLWPEPTEDERTQARNISLRDYEVEKLFAAYGYNPMAAFQDVVTAFHRHYYPEAIGTPSEGVPCEETVARLLSLIRQQQGNE